MVPVTKKNVTANALIYPVYDDDDVYLKKITTRVSQNLLLHKNADQPKA
jgi:hypothetical protein